LKLIGGKTSLLFAVGDDDQSIYTFRGANVGNMADFEREFKVARVIRLEQNYRSHGNILDAANALIANNRKRLGKNLWTAAGKGEPVRVFEGESDNDEARWIVEEVQSLARDGTALSQMAVLYRSNAQSRVVEHALFSQGIPYRVYGGLRFFERAEIKHALAYLRLIATPDDDSSFLRVANFPPRGIGARTIEQLQDAAKQAGASLMKVAAGTKAAPFRALIENLGNETQGLPLKEMVDVVIAKSGLIEHYKAEREGADRIENLAELLNAAAAFTEEERVAESGEAIDPLTAFLTHAALEAGEHQAGEGADALQMMTVHSAKGLEFDAVFISGLEEGLFPHEQSVTERDGLEEERRLAYVAITRARNRLYLSHAQTRMLHGQTRYNIPSRFLEEIPQQLLKWLTPRFSRQKMLQAGGWSARPSPVSKPSRDVGGFRIGQNVMHPKFGSGVIIDAEGQGTDARVQVNFGNQGVKWLALAVAKLQAA
jgi:DNA helicase-2/ATP-dependent DNA helicase PcrA